jgi:hypothetical protein
MMYSVKPEVQSAGTWRVSRHRARAGSSPQGSRDKRLFESRVEGSCFVEAVHELNRLFLCVDQLSAIVGGY